MTRRAAPPSLLSALTSLAERSGAAVGDVYAAAARVVLDGWERLEDLDAERRLRHRTSSARRAARGTAKPGVSPTSTPAIARRPTPLEPR